MTQHRKALRLIVIAGGSLICFWLTAQPTAAVSVDVGVATPCDEHVSWRRLDSGVRVFVNAPATPAARPRVLIVYATPNGNAIEQTLGCAAAKDLDWRFDIQHIAPQMRRLREIDAVHEFVLAVVQAPKLSWPTFRREQAEANTIIRQTNKPSSLPAFFFRHSERQLSNGKRT